MSSAGVTSVHEPSASDSSTRKAGAADLSVLYNAVVCTTYAVPLTLFRESFSAAVLMCYYRETGYDTGTFPLRIHN
jgi:hypothetical protein